MKVIVKEARVYGLIWREGEGRKNIKGKIPKCIYFWDAEKSKAFFGALLTF